MNGIIKMMKMNRCLPLFLTLLVLTSNFAAAGDGQSVKLTGKWQFSWVARLGTESGTLQLEQNGSNLTGGYQGHVVSSKLTGTVQDKNVTLNIDFAGAHPFTIVFTGTVDGDKMAGKFSIVGAKDGYDSHGESAHPSNYSWNAVRQADQTQSASSQPNQTNQK